jgi:hypothetical protein
VGLGGLTLGATQQRFVTLTRGLVGIFLKIVLSDHQPIFVSR